MRYLSNEQGKRRIIENLFGRKPTKINLVCVHNQLLNRGERVSETLIMLSVKMWNSVIPQVKRDVSLLFRKWRSLCLVIIKMRKSS